MVGQMLYNADTTPTNHFFDLPLELQEYVSMIAEEHDYEMPELVEIEPPDGVDCTDIDGNVVEIGDRVEMVLTGRIFHVGEIMYIGYEDREDAKMWDEPGFVLDDEERNGYNNASECRKIAEESEE